MKIPPRYFSLFITAAQKILRKLPGIFTGGLTADLKIQFF